uniref:Secreted protein n=1 Tax=Arundo donax TaxID=35708 RepID=A0A0A9C1V1_ARUDO
MNTFTFCQTLIALIISCLDSSLKRPDVITTFHLNRPLRMNSTLIRRRDWRFRPREMKFHSRIGGSNGQNLRSLE